MVNPELVVAARALLGQPQRILVTGGSGFVGSQLARTLADAGHCVTATGRNAYAVHYCDNQIRFARVDIRDRDEIVRLCSGQDLVFHVAAKTAPWGDPAVFHAINVEGTRNVTEGCLFHNVKRLVHVSSTAIFFEFKDKTAIRDDAPLATNFSTPYAASKAEAESVIQAAHQQGLNTFIIRARAVFGPGDNQLLPRLLDLAKRRKLRQVGKGNVIDFTYIDNLVYALLLASVRGTSGGVCTITDGDPVSLWPLLQEAMRQLNFNEPLRKIPYRLAMLAATSSELMHRFRRLDGEPAVTRYSIGLLSKTQTFDLTAAHQQLGYQPLVSTQQGLQRTIMALEAREDSPSATSMTCRLFTTGYTQHPRSYVERGAPRLPTRFHATIALIDHPKHGLTLFDTGYSPRFLAATRALPYVLYRKLTPIVTSTADSALAIVQRAGRSAADVRRIILSHFHADHLCGLMDFPQADVIARRTAWEDVRGRHGIRALRRGFLPDLVPDGVEKRLHLLDHFHGPGMGPFEQAHDLFGDGSLRLFELEGHAVGHIGALVQLEGQQRTLLLADAVWSTNTITQSLPFTQVYKLMAASPRQANQTRQKLIEFHKQYPEIELIPAHCPQVAERYGFDEQLRSCAGEG